MFAPPPWLRAKMKLRFPGMPVQSEFGRLATTPDSRRGVIVIHWLWVPLRSQFRPASVRAKATAKFPHVTASSAALLSMNSAARLRYCPAGFCWDPVCPPTSKWSKTLVDPFRPWNDAVHPPPSSVMSQGTAAVAPPSTT